MPARLDVFQLATLCQLREAGGRVQKSSIVLPDTIPELVKLGLVKVTSNKRMDRWSLEMVSLVA